MIRIAVATVALVAFAGAASAQCSSNHTVKKEQMTPITTAQLPDGQPAQPKPN